MFSSSARSLAHTIRLPLDPGWETRSVMSAPRRFHHADFPPARLAATRAETVSVCLPARDEVETIGPILDALLPLREAGVVDQVVVVDDSGDGTAERARALGAEVHAQADLAPELGPV